jgi:hypothetical protein
MNADLKRRAKKAGIGVRTKPCRSCDGKGKFDVVDGLDLQRVRNKAGVSGYRVAQMAGKQPSYVKMVEEVDPDKEQRKCSDELLAVYVEIAEKGVPEELKKKSGGKREAGYAAGAKNLRRTNLLRPPMPKVKKGQVWEKKGPVKEGLPPFRVEVLHVEGSTALIRRFDEPDGIGRTLRTETLMHKWQDVTQEVRG